MLKVDLEGIDLAEEEAGKGISACGCASGGGLEIGTCGCKAEGSGWVAGSYSVELKPAKINSDLEDVRAHGSREGIDELRHRGFIVGEGSAGLTELLKLRGADLYEREIFNQREMRTSKALGWMTTAKTREVIVENMARAIREWDRPGDGFDIFDANAVEQFENFVVKESGRSEAAAGYHDDDVLALCIGLQLIDHATAYVPERFFGNVPPDLRETPPGPQNMQFS